ncbi:MAG: hypothetical protein AAB329_06610, partial [Pseudomonadota bacterium]
DSIHFSPDGQRVVYAARRDRQYRLVDNGREGQPYDLLTVPVISPDGKYVAVTAVRGPRHVAVVNGVESKPVQGLLPESRVVFSDPARFHFMATRRDTLMKIEIAITP